jgi:protein-S-isoprenylcysteine O-methyltransferase Ste14
MAGWFAAGYVTLAGFFALEVATRERGSASRLDTTVDDQSTTRNIVLAYTVAGLAAPFARLVPARELPGSAGPIGLIVEASGIALRAWSMRTLGRAYSRTLRTEADQHVVQAGPYAVVRHPGYLGSLMTWIGFSLTSRSFLAVAIVSAVLVDAYRRRIGAEELLLRRDLPGYAAYSDRTWRLIPYLW